MDLRKFNRSKINLEEGNNSIKTSTVCLINIDFKRQF